MIHRTALFAGVALAAAGTVMLVGVNDATAGDAILSALRLWPLAIIAFGVALLARRTRFAVAGTLLAALLAGVLVGGAAVAAPELPSVCHDRDAVSLPTRSGTFDGAAEVELDLGCGDLDVGTVNAGETRLDLGTTTVTSLDIDINAGSATVLLPIASDLVGELDVSAGAIEI